MNKIGSLEDIIIGQGSDDSESRTNLSADKYIESILQNILYSDNSSENSARKGSSRLQSLEDLIISYKGMEQQPINSMNYSPRKGYDGLGSIGPNRYYQSESQYISHIKKDDGIEYMLTKYLDNSLIQNITKDDMIYKGNLFQTPKIIENYSSKVITRAIDHYPKEEKGRVARADEFLNSILSQQRTQGDKAKDLAHASVEVLEAKQVPDAYAHVFSSLQDSYPGISYAGKVTLTDTQHTVEVLRFEYRDQGTVRQLYVVAKDKDPLEQAIPAFLQGLGIPTHSIYDDNGRIFMQHVGERDVSDVVRHGSESDVMAAARLVISRIAEIHAIATGSLHSLKDDYNADIARADYLSEFRSRFLLPVSGDSAVISPQMQHLMQAYSSFARAFTPTHFSHGDFHPGNCRIAGDECYIIDFEWAKVRAQFDDPARFVNAVTRARPHMDAGELSREVLTAYVQSYNEAASGSGRPVMRQSERMASRFLYSMINDELYKVGEKVLFAGLHPDLRPKKILESLECFDRAIGMIDGAMQTLGNTTAAQQKVLSDLRSALVDYAATTPLLKETARKYQGRAAYQPIIIAPAPVRARGLVYCDR